MKATLLLVAALLLLGTVDAQQDSTERIYSVKVRYELPAAGAGLILFSAVGLPALIKNARVSEADLAKLDPADVNWFDRPVIFKPVSGYSNAIGHSDIFLNASLLSPALLMFDKKIRHEWVNTITMYMVTHAINNTIFLATVSAVRRPRPLVYKTDISVEERTSKGKTNSFYSGHVSNAAASTFFIVKLYTDYHHIKGWKRLAMYAVASVPPAMVGYYRQHAGRHFKTDVIAGFLVGATSGIMVPELHRIKNKHNNLSMEPWYSPESMGVSFKWALN